MSNNNQLPPDEGVRFVEVSQDEIKARQKEAWSNERSFFEWWKNGVMIAGYQYFGDGTKQGFVEAKDKNDLRPDPDMIEKAIGEISDGEIAFLTTMYCFYNDYRGAQLCAKANVKSIGNVMILDSARRKVIASLLTTYCVW